MLQTARQRLLYVFVDYVSANTAWFLFNVVRYFTLPYNHNAMSFGSYMSMTTVIVGQICLPLMMVALFAISGYYNKVFFKSRLDDITNSLSVSLIATIIIFFAALFNDTIDDRMGNIEMIAILWMLMGVICLIPRLVVTSLTKSDIQQRKLSFNTVIIGNPQKALALAHDLESKHRAMGHRVMGIVPIQGDASAIGDEFPTYSLDEICEKEKSLDIKHFIIVPTSESANQMVETINRLLPTGRSVLISPDMIHVLGLRPRTAMVAGQVLLDISNANISASTANLKRIGDIAFSAIALVALSPLMAALALLIKRDSPGPVIYKQQRIGYKKKPFNIYKFRTMRTDAEAEGPALSSIDDPRITRIGRALRKYRLDELPQFWNVLRGDMSVVGPRPEREYYLKQIIERAPYFNIVHQVRPGITSWGMVKYGYASNVEQMIERMKYELIYIENVSFGVDMKILFYTIRTVCTGKGV